MMHYRKLGRSGLSVSAVGLGCNNFALRTDFEQSKAVVEEALDCGITFFDTADVYAAGESEAFLGRILGPQRKNVIIATKFGLPMGEGKNGASRRYAVQAVEASLKRLNTDYIDLYQVHVPDPGTPIEETLQALEDLRRAGKILYSGGSQMVPIDIVEASWAARSLNVEGYISSQSEYSILERTKADEAIPQLVKYGMGLLPYFPLANGLLSGKYSRSTPAPEGSRLLQPNTPWMEREAKKLITESKLEVVRRLDAFATERGRDSLALAFAWLLANPVVGSVIAGASWPEQVKQNAAAHDWMLNASEISVVDQLVLDGRPRSTSFERQEG